MSHCPFQPPPPPPPDPAAIACRRCRARLGVSRGGCVDLGAVRVAHRVVLTCAGCGMKRAWRPGGREPAAGDGRAG